VKPEGAFLKTSSHSINAERRSTPLALTALLSTHPQAAPIPAHSIFVPHLRDRVRMAGSAEIFFVVFVDLRRGVADLACAQRVGFVSHVPFKSLFPAIR